MRDMTIGKKLTISFVALIALTLVLSYTSLNAIGKLKESFDHTADKTTRKIELAATINTSESDMVAGQRGLILYTYAKDSSGAAAAKQLFRGAAAAIAKAVQEMRPLLVTEEGKRLTAEMESLLTAWTNAFGEMERQCDAGDPGAALKIATEKGLAYHEALNKAAMRQAEIQREALTSDQANAAGLYSQSRWIAFLLIGLSIGVGGLIVFVVRQISRALQQIAAELAADAEQVASASGQVSASSQALAQGASEQAASIEETSASSEEITSMTHKNAENSKAAAEHMMEAARVVGEANRSLEQMVSSMKEINASSDKISKIIKVIDEIAFQTNILALNAAVEAARAGEAGMGFAVVADEVRNLAQRSAQAAKDTAGLIEESIAKSNEGSGKLDQVAAAIRGITESANKVKTLVEEVKVGSEEQARGIEQIAKAISQMEQVTQKAAANAEESASAGEEMSAQAESLHVVVERLRAMVGGDGSEHSAQPRAASRSRGKGKPGSAGALRNAEALPGLHALHTAVSRQTGSEQFDKQPVLEHTRKAKENFPLDEDFKEF